MLTYLVIFLAIIFFPKSVAKKAFKWTMGFLANNTGDSLAAGVYKKASGGKRIKWSVVDDEEEKVG